MLDVEALETSYGDSQILFGVGFSVGAGEVVTLLGRNGMGKTTTIKSVFGLVRPKGGLVRVAGVDVTGAAPHKVAQLGLGLVPEGRQVFPTLTVEENLVATARTPGTQGPGGAAASTDTWTLDRVYGLFPRLAERRRNKGNQLSGGEQQMLAIGRALMTNPRLVVLDEATEGLAPLIREEIWTCLDAIRRTGTAILIIDKNVDRLVKLADRHVVIEKGRVVWSGTSAELAETPAVKDDYLHV